MRPHIVFAFPLPSNNVGISYTALSIYRAMRAEGYDVSFVTPVRRKDVAPEGITETSSFPFKEMSWKYQRRLAYGPYRRKLLALAKPGVVIHLWSDHPTSLYREIRQRGGVICKEKFNCAQRVSRQILLAESAANGIALNTKISDATVAEEEQQFALADYVVSPSPMVADSLAQCGVAAPKVIAASYGWNPRSEPRVPVLPEGLPRPWFLFVGTFCLRKGAHLLLNYWEAAGVEGTLLVMGRVAADMAEATASARLPRGVTLLGHQEKAHQIFRAADAFVFPSLEEGSPLVTYEAIGSGLPCLVSPMGAGGAVRDGSEGFVLDPHDAGAWVNGIRRLAADAKLRAVLSSAASERSLAFTWPEVARQRYASLLGKLRADFPAQGWQE